MKKLMIGLLALGSLSAFAQVVNIDDFIYQEMGVLAKSHTESGEVEQIKLEIEQKYSVKCEGKSSTVLPDITKKITYSASCSGAAPIKLTIKSKFKATKSGYEFIVKNYKVDL